MSLLSDAKKIGNKGVPVSITDEHIELALGWVRNEVKFSQIMKVMKFNGNASVYNFLASTLKIYIQNQSKK